MTNRTHDVFRLAAVVVNIAAFFMSAMAWSSLVRLPLSAWNPWALLMLVVSSAPPLSLVAIMVKPRER